MARVALFTASLLFVPLVIVLALALSESTETNVMQLLVESLRLSTPVALGAMAALWCERSGVVNIGIEGTMLAVVRAPASSPTRCSVMPRTPGRSGSPCWWRSSPAA